MKKTIALLSFLLILFSSSGNLNAQNDYNKTDKQGRRQGKWIDYHYNGNIKYIGEFKDNEPAGEFIYYSEGGVLIAKGEYKNKKKHGRWEFYSDKNGSLILSENYENGVIVGKSISYSHVSNMIIEEIEYVDGMKNGICKKYYDNGRLMEESFYKNDKLEGRYVFYYPNGIIKEEGDYNEDRRVGEWKTYDMEENIISVDIYQ